MAQLFQGPGQVNVTSFINHSLLFCPFTALFVPSLEQGACLWCYLFISYGECYKKVHFPRWRYHHISRPTLSSFNVILMVHQGVVGAQKDMCNCWPMQCGRGNIIWLLILLIQCDGICVRHVPLKLWVAVFEVGLPWSCHDRGKCLKNPFSPGQLLKYAQPWCQTCR